MGFLCRAERGTERDCALYGMVERFCCALEQLGFPYPKGAFTLLITLFLTDFFKDFTSFLPLLAIVVWSLGKRD